MTTYDAGGEPDEGEAALAVAVRLMRMALPLLDRADRELAVVHLQHALDLAGGDGTSPEEALGVFESEEPLLRGIR